jgi:hypothetical protein
MYLAARAAVRAATGQGSEKGQLGEPERAGLRRQALDRLRAGLELTAELRNEGKAAGGSLTTWQNDGWTRPRRGSISTVTGCQLGPKTSQGCTSTTGWKRTSCAARRKH